MVQAALANDLSGLALKRAKAVKDRSQEAICDLGTNGGDPRKFYGRDSWQSSRDLCTKLAKDYGIKTFDTVDGIMQLPGFEEVIDKALIFEKSKTDLDTKRKFFTDLHSLFISIIKPLTLIIEDYVKQAVSLASEDDRRDAIQRLLAHNADKGIDLGSDLKLYVDLSDNFKYPELKITKSNKNHFLSIRGEFENPENYQFDIWEAEDDKGIKFGCDQDTKLNANPYDYSKSEESFELNNLASISPMEFGKTYIPRSFKIGGEIYSALEQYN